MEQPSLFELALEPLRKGPWRWIAALVWIFGIGLVGIAMIAAGKMCDAKDLRGVVLWATTFLACLVGIVAVKVWYWLDINRRLVERRLERLEAKLERA